MTLGACSHKTFCIFNFIGHPARHEISCRKSLSLKFLRSLVQHCTNNSEYSACYLGNAVLEMFEYMTVRESAEFWNISVRWV